MGTQWGFIAPPLLWRLPASFFANPPLPSVDCSSNWATRCCNDAISVSFSNSLCSICTTFFHNCRSKVGVVTSFSPSPSNTWSGSWRNEIKLLTTISFGYCNHFFSNMVIFRMMGKFICTGIASVFGRVWLMESISLFISFFHSSSMNASTVSWSTTSIKHTWSKDSQPLNRSSWVNKLWGCWRMEKRSESPRSFHLLPRTEQWPRLWSLHSRQHYSLSTTVPPIWKHLHKRYHRLQQHKRTHCALHTCSGHTQETNQRCSAHGPVSVDPQPPSRKMSSHHLPNET